MTGTVEVQFCFEDHEHMAEGAERLKALLHTWNIAFENMDEVNEYFTFALPDDNMLVMYIRAIMDATQRAAREITLQFGQSRDESCIRMVSTRFEECIGRALELCRYCGDYEIKIMDVE